MKFAGQKKVFPWMKLIWRNSNGWWRFFLSLEMEQLYIVTLDQWNDLHWTSGKNRLELKATQ